MSHTPGPWEYTGVFVEHDDGGVICNPHANGFGVREAAANGCLIAAAPELLRAVQVAYEFFLNPTSFDIPSVERLYLDAIAKATGGAE